MKTVSHKKNTNLEDEHSFKAILENPITLVYYKSFLDKRLCSENLRFWIVINNYHEKFENINPDYAMKIYKKYIEDGSEYEVNVSASQKRKIKDLLDKNKINIDIFDEAQNEIFKLMITNDFDKFVHSDMYTEAKKLLGEYN